MSSMFKRISDVIAANINELIDRVEDPERMIKQIIREMEENIGQAKEGVIDAVASEKQLAKEVEEHRRQVASWLEKAETAVAQGKEELARAALARKKEHERILANLEPAWQAAANTSAGLKAQLRALELKLDEAKRKKGTLVARQRAAQARQHMAHTADAFSASLEATHNFTRMEDRVAEMEARTEAMAEVNDDSSSLERELARMSVDTEVEAELAALKSKLDHKQG